MSPRRKKRGARIDAFREAIRDLSRAVEGPIQPGERRRWLEAVQSEVDDFGPLLETQIKEVHHRDYEEIKREKPQLLTRVEKLKKTDAEILDAFERIDERLTSLGDVPVAELDKQPDYEEALKDLRGRLLELITNVRKQEAAVTDWWLETLYREEGIVD